MAGDGVLDVLSRVNAGRHRPGFLPYIGEPDVFVFYGFLLGLEAARLYSQGPDPEYVGFREWLRDVKREYPADGWHRKFLTEAGGSHLMAIERYLDRVVEYRNIGRSLS